MFTEAFPRSLESNLDIFVLNFLLFGSFPLLEKENMRLLIISNVARIPNWLSFIFSTSGGHKAKIQNLAHKGISYTESRWTSSSKGHFESSIGPEMEQMDKVLKCKQSFMRENYSNYPMLVQKESILTYTFLPSTCVEW